MKSYLFLGFAIPDFEMSKVFDKDKFPSVQTHKFNWNLIKALESNFKNSEIIYLSFRAVSDYPYYKEKIIKRKEWTIKVLEKKINIYEIPYINTSLLKILSRLFFGFYYSIKKFHSKKKKGAVIAYSVHVPIMIIGYLISKIYRIEFIGVWTDPPSVSNKRESNLKSRLRRLELKISKYLMKKANKVIVLTKFLADDFAPQKPYLVIEGFSENIEKKYEHIKRNKDLVKIVYTGSLEEKYGIGNIVDAIISLSNKNIILEIYGRGDYEDKLKEISLKNKNINYKGFVKNKEILEIQREADFLINARSAFDEYVKYSFPSKTLEYMSSGTPLITTMLPGIPDEYEDYIYILKDNNLESIKEKIEKLIKIPREERVEFGLRAQEFIKIKNYRSQGEKIIDFIELEKK